MRAPANIVAKRENAPLVREAARKLNIPYVEKAVQQNGELIRFTFQLSSDDELAKLLGQLPSDVFAHRAVFTGTPANDL